MNNQENTSNEFALKDNKNSSKAIKAINVTEKEFREVFIKCNHLVINSHFFSNLPIYSKKIVKDTRDTCYLLFQNGAYEIKENTTRFINYEEFRTKCIWQDQIIKRSFSF